MVSLNEWLITEQVTMSIDIKLVVSGFCFRKNVLSGRWEGVVVFDKTGLTVIFSLSIKTCTDVLVNVKVILRVNKYCSIISHQCPCCKVLGRKVVVIIIF